jgi:hypothetical protein
LAEVNHRLLGCLTTPGIRDIQHILKAIGLSGVLLILLTINHQWGIREFRMPLSVIIIFSLLSMIGLTASHFIFKALYNTFLTNDLK